MKLRRTICTIVVPLAIFFGGSAISVWAITEFVPAVPNRIGETPENGPRTYTIELPECNGSAIVPCANRDEENEWRVIFEYAPNGSPLRYADIQPY